MAAPVNTCDMDVSSSRASRLEEGDSLAVQGGTEANRSTATSLLTDDPMLAPARTVLRDWTVARYLAAKEPLSGPPVVLTSDTTVGEALDLFAGAGILSAPVLDCCKDELDSAVSWLGFVDVADIVRSMLRELYPWLLDEPHRSTAHGMMAALANDPVNIETVLQEWAREIFLIRWVRLLRPSADGDILYKGLAYKSLLEVISFGLAGLPVQAHPGMHGLVPCHRIAVFDVMSKDTGGAGQERGDDQAAAPPFESDAPTVLRITAVISQSDMVTFLLFNAQQGNLGELPHRSVAALGWVRDDVVCVPANMPTVAAFALMMNRGVSAAGVTASPDAGSRLVASISVSDIRALRTAADFDAFALPVDKFLEGQYGKVNKEGSEVENTLRRLNVDPSKPLLWLVSCFADDTFGAVLEKMVSCGVHRVWIVDRVTGAARGVVTCSDILQLLAVDPSTDSRGWLEGTSVAF